MKMYHYTNPEGWDGIRNGKRGYLIRHPVTNEMVESETVKGWMVPHRRLVSLGLESSLVPEQARLGAIFGLPEPRPKSWVEYQDSVKMFEYLMGSCARGEKLVLLKINLIPADNPIVVDLVHIRRAAKDLKEIKDPQKYAQRVAEGYKKYWDSRIEYDKYQSNFILPEVVVFSPIPIERIEFVEEIPLH